MGNIENTLVINPLEDMDKIKALASVPRVKMISLLREKTLNINEISAALGLPQSTVATHISILEDAGIIITESIKAIKNYVVLHSTTFSFSFRRKRMNLMTL